MPLQEFEDWWRNHPKKWLQFPQAQKISAKAAWDAMEEKFTSTNSDYAAARKVYLEYEKETGGGTFAPNFEAWVCQRLNSAKAPNCA